MYVKILFDTRAKKGLLSGWGFSCFVTGGVLFDTGKDAVSLLENMERMMVSISDLKSVVISHEHWDHTGGLWDLLKKHKGLKVYARASFSDTFKRCVKESGGELIIVRKTTEIAKNIFLGGAMKGSHRGKNVYEQALVVRGEKGMSIITGCAHPGIVEMIKNIKKRFKKNDLYMAFGGFHLEDKKRDELERIVRDIKNEGVEKIGPAHCSGEKARRVFKGKFGKNFVEIKGGCVIHL
ncbi:MAG: MBL fold metallo-hydrolase [Candidatus Omnitrophota bacterium]